MGITHPWFLLGLLAVAIPILIHLFELRRPKRILFTNVGFIREVRIVTARQRKVKHLLILLARIAFVVFLVLMFAQPFIPALIQSQNSQQVAPAILVDTSPSMQGGEANELTNFDRAVTQARALPTAYPGGTRFTLNGEVNSPLMPAAYQVAIDRLNISGQSAGLGGLLLRANSTEAKAKQLFVFSDFQKSTFSQRDLRGVDSTAQVFLVPMASSATRNVFVDSVWLDDAFVRRNADINLHIRLRNGGSQAVQSCQVKLFMGLKQATAFNASVSTQAPATMTARIRLSDEQAQLCRIELEDFPVTFDNTFYFSLQASPAIRVLEVAGTAGQSLQRVYGNEPLFAYAQASAGRVNYEQLDKANLVLIQGLDKVDAALRAGLRRVLGRGGSVVIVPPAAAAGRATYDQLFRELGVGSVQWETPGSQAGTREVAAPDRRNPFFRDVFGAPSRQPVMPKVTPVLRWARSGTDILRLQDGDGFLSAFGSGKGTTYVFSAPFDGATTDFMQHALFVPVMYRLAMQSYRREQQLAYRLNQGTVAVNVESSAAGQGEQVYKLASDSLTFIPAQRVQAGVVRFEVPAGMRQPGFYKLTRGGQPVATLAFNNDKRESELAAYTPTELRQLIGPGHPNVQVYEPSQGTSVAARYKAERVGTPLWQYCLWAALACLLAEVLLLRFMGSPETEAPVRVAA